MQQNDFLMTILPLSFNICLSRHTFCIFKSGSKPRSLSYFWLLLFLAWKNCLLFIIAHHKAMMKNLTSRDRPKSAPYLRLKNTKRTSKCQSIGELGTLLWKFFFEKKSHNAEKNWKGGPFGIFQNPFCPKISKTWRRDPSLKNKFFKKKSHRAENTLWPRWVS